MRSHRVDTDPVLKGSLISPAFDRVIIACGKEQVLARMPPHFLYVTLVTAEHTHAAVFIIIFLLVDPDRFIAAASRDVVRVRAPGNTFNFVFVTVQRQPRFKVQNLCLSALRPETGLSIEARACDDQVSCDAMRLPRY